jgi:hypothetical protein
VFVQRKVLRKSRKVQPQSAPPDCGFSTSATPKEFGAISPAGTGLSLQNCNHWQDKFFAWILLRQPGRRQLHYYNIVIGVMAFKLNEPGSRKLYE